MFQMPGVPPQAQMSYIDPHSPRPQSNMSALSGMQQPKMTGMPPPISAIQPPATGMQPSMSGMQMSMPGSRPPMPGSSDHTSGVQPQFPSMPAKIDGQQTMPSMQPPVNGIQHQATDAQPKIAGMLPSMPGTQISTHGGTQMPMPGWQPHMPPKSTGLPTPMPGTQPPMNGVQSQIPASQPPMPGMHPQMPGMPPKQNGMQPSASVAQPQMNGMQPHTPNLQPPMSGMQSPMRIVQQPMSGMQSQMSGMQPQMPRLPPQMPGMQPQVSGMQPQMPGMQSQMSGMQPQMPGIQSQMSGMQPQMPGMQPQMSGMQPQMSGGMHNQMAGGMHSQMPGGMPYPGQMPGMQQQQQKRLDPNMMPSAIQVIDDDRKIHSGLFQTGYPRAELPPLVTSDFFCEDQGNCNPKFIRSTLYSGPINNELLKQSAIPFALSISPVTKLNDKERPLPVIDMGDLGPVRCHRCKAYMCPYMEFNYGGRRFFCPFCKANTDVPTEYFAHLDQNGQRTDICERPELCFGSYEFVATKEYCKNNILPKPPAFIFMLDVSYNSCRIGLIKLFCENIKILLSNLPKEANAAKSEIKVGFATYDQTVHFYSLKSALGQPKMLIINDVQDTFVPIVDGFLVGLDEAEGVIDSLLSQIPLMFADSKITEVVLGAAVQAGMDALKAADRPGKLFVFHTSLPTFDAPGKLKNRDDKQVIGTDKEKQVLLPQSEFYTKLAQDCVAVGCCVDMFLFPNSYIDVATIGTMCGLTGGQVYKYQYFQAETDGQRLLNDLKHNIERPIVFDAIMRVRTSTGIRPTEFFGNFFMQNTTDIELAAIDSDKTITVEIKHDDKIEDQSVFFQAALLFTSVSGQRRLRIHNLSLNIGTDIASLYRSSDLFSVVSYLTKQGERLLLTKAPRDVRESLVNRSAQILAAYRQHCSPAGSSLGQLVLPETMKLLPLMINCVIKHSAFTGGADLSFDDRAWLMQNIPAMSILDMVYYLYPRLIPVMEPNEEITDELPVAIRCAYENLLPTGAYLFENSVVIMLWIGQQISNQWIVDVFGVQSFAQINADKHELPEKDNATSRFVRKIFTKLQENRTRHMKLYIIKQQDKLEPWFKKFMVEDRGADSSPSYVEFLCHIHKEIRNLLN